MATLPDVHIGTVAGIGVALAMDAFAVSIASGIAIQNLRIRHALTIAAWFGLFQAIMPLLGWLGGIRLRETVAAFDHWLAFLLLNFLGGKMIYEARAIREVEERADPLKCHVLFGLSLATSLDALAAGFSFALLDMTIVAPVLIIGGITFLMCFAGVLIGDHGGHFFENKMEIAGGLLLIAIGWRILLLHLL